MIERLQFYIDGCWVDPVDPPTARIDVIDPSTENVVGRIAMGSAGDIDLAVAAARRAFSGFSKWNREARLELLGGVLAEYRRRFDDVVDAIILDIGAPLHFVRETQAAMGVAHLEAAITALKEYRFDERRGSALITREPIGVCGFITPWNWPINQIACKVAPALATGCTMVLKPSELAPLSAIVWTEICAAAGVPRGVFNLVNGDGPTVGSAIARHPDIDMVSFTGSTRAGIEVAKLAATTVKRVHQELGGKSPHIVLDDDGLAEAVAWNVDSIALNAGQNCNAPTRLLVPRRRMADAVAIARQKAGSLTLGKPHDRPDLGPVISLHHWRRIQSLITGAIAEGAQLVTGGPDLPDGLSSGYFVRPTVFADVTNGMTIAREEVFGPVLVIIAYDDLNEAIEIANDTPYGLASYVSGLDVNTVSELAGHLRTGQVNLNRVPPDYMAPFGGYKRSGNGREWGNHALTEFLETKAVLGAAAVS